MKSQNIKLRKELPLSCSMECLNAQLAIPKFGYEMQELRPKIHSSISQWNCSEQNWELTKE
jgi:hypothetical protein